jgi:hypothetical protein
MADCWSRCNGEPQEQWIECVVEALQCIFYSRRLWSHPQRLASVQKGYVHHATIVATFRIQVLGTHAIWSPAPAQTVDQVTHFSSSNPAWHIIMRAWFQQDESDHGIIEDGFVGWTLGLVN